MCINYIDYSIGVAGFIAGFIIGALILAIVEDATRSYSPTIILEKQGFFIEYKAYEIRRTLPAMSCTIRQTF